jgi:hypothetical protein
VNKTKAKSLGLFTTEDHFIIQQKEAFREEAGIRLRKPTLQRTKEFAPSTANSTRQH